MHSSSNRSSNVELPPLLRLPLELRRLIYRHVLPHTELFDVRFQRGNGDVEARSAYNLTYVRTSPDTNGSWKMLKTQPRSDREAGNEVVWRLGCTAVLATCHQIHDECVERLYGDNVFVLDVSFDQVRFRQRWRTANNLTPGRNFAFLEHFSQRNLMKIKNYVVNVEHVDDYTGMIKYNCGGRGLTVGIRSKVQELVDLLGAVHHLHRLHVHLIDGAISRVRFSSGRVHRVQDVQNYTTSQMVLDPFRGIYGVRRAKVTGVSEEYAKALEEDMTETRGLSQS